MDASTRHSDHLPPIWNICEPRDDRFLLDDRIVASLHTSLRQNPICIVEPEDSVHGRQDAAGLAREYAYRHADEYQAVWWVHGRHEAAMALEYTQLARALEMVAGSDNDAFKTIESVIELLTDHTGWLLIFDDIADPALVNALLPETVDGHVIITSPHATPESETPKIVVPPVDPVELAQSYTGDDFAPEDVPAPLAQSRFALDMLSATARATEQSMRAMLKTIGKALENENAPDVNTGLQMVIRYPLSVVADRMPAARDYLAMCAFLAASDIPRFLFHNGGEIVTKRLARIFEDDHEFQQMLELLSAFGLIRFDEHTTTVHPQFQATLRSTMADNARQGWVNAVQRLLEQAFPVETTYRQPSKTCAQLTPHVLQATQLAEEEEIALPLAGSLLYRVGLYLHAHDLLPHAQMCYLRSINIAERKLGTVHPDIATRVNSLGIIEHRLGNLDNAQTCFERAFEICETLHGPATKEDYYANITDEMLTMPLRNLCLVLEEKGNVSRAQRAFEKAMRIFVDVYGWNNSVVAECAHSFGMTWVHLGKYQKAQNCFVKAVRAEENADNCNNEALARYLDSLGMSLIQNDQHEAAIEQIERSVRLFQAGFGENDQRLTRPYVHLGHASRELGKLDKARQAYSQALKLLEESEEAPSPAEHAKLLQNLGSIMVGKNEPGLARSCLDESLRLLTEEKGSSAPELVPALVTLGKTLDDLDAVTQARENYNRALTILNEHDSENYSDHATILYRLGRSHELEEDLNIAKEYYEKAMNMDSTHLGQDHPHVARDSSGLASVLAKQGDTIVAMGHLTHALDIYESKLGKDHAKTRSVRRKLDKLTM